MARPDFNWLNQAAQLFDHITDMDPHRPRLVGVLHLPPTWAILRFLHRAEHRTDAFASVWIYCDPETPLLLLDTQRLVYNVRFSPGYKFEKCRLIWAAFIRVCFCRLSDPTGSPPSWWGFLCQDFGSNCVILLQIPTGGYSILGGFAVVYPRQDMIPFFDGLSLKTGRIDCINVPWNYRVWCCCFSGLVFGS